MHQYSENGSQHKLWSNEYTDTVQDFFQIQLIIKTPIYMYIKPKQSLWQKNIPWLQIRIVLYYKTKEMKELKQKQTT